MCVALPYVCSLETLYINTPPVAVAVTLLSFPQSAYTATRPADADLCLHKHPPTANNLKQIANTYNQTAASDKYQYTK